MQLHLVGIELRHLRGFPDEVIKPVALFINNGEKFVPLGGIKGGAREQGGH